MAYEITRNGLELPRGERRNTSNSKVELGDLCLIKIGPHLIIGRWIPGWIIQPGRWIRLTSEVIIKALGLVMLFVA